MNDKNMDNCDRFQFTLYRPITYQIKIAGRLSENWSDWINEMDIQIEANATGLTTTILTGTVDQAALIGLLRQLYFRGFPLIAVNGIEDQILVTGDACNTLDQFDSGIGSGSYSSDPEQAQEVLNRIIKFKERYPDFELVFGHNLKTR